MVKSNSSYDITEYIIPTEKLDTGDEKVVVTLADLHDYTKNRKKASELAEAIKSLNPDYINIAGDNMQGSKWENSKAIANFAYFLENLSEASPVCVSQGNHDLVGTNEKNHSIRTNNFKNLENVRPGMVFPLVNDRIDTIDGFEIIGYTPSHELIGGLAIQQHGVAHDRFIREFNNCGFRPTANNDKIIEFVGHNPYLIACSENGVGLGALEFVDTFFCGHLHCGYYRSSDIENNPDKYLDLGFVEKPYVVDNGGIFIPRSINPKFFGETNLCRGVVYIDDNAQQRLLQLRNGHFYMNLLTDDNKQRWYEVSEQLAYSEMVRTRMHAVVITEGINKFFGFDIPGDQPSFTKVHYKGLRKA